MNTLAILLVVSLSISACATDGNKSTLSEPTTSAVLTAQDGPAYTDMSAAEFAKKMEEEGVAILDVRTPAETAKGKIGTAEEADFLDKENFTARLSELDPDRTYLVYCAAGSRSAKACKIMAEAGFDQLYNLKGGYRAWQASIK